MTIVLFLLLAAAATNTVVSAFYLPTAKRTVYKVTETQLRMTSDSLSSNADHILFDMP